MGSSDGLLFVYSDPGTIPVTEFNDWYDNEHGPARLTVPGISAGYRFRALDGQAPPKNPQNPQNPRDPSR